MMTYRSEHMSAHTVLHKQLSSASGWRVDDMLDFNECNDTVTNKKRKTDTPNTPTTNGGECASTRRRASFRRFKSLSRFHILDSAFSRMLQVLSSTTSACTAGEQTSTHVADTLDLTLRELQVLSSTTSACTAGEHTQVLTLRTR